MPGVDDTIGTGGVPPTTLGGVPPMAVSGELLSAAVEYAREWRWDVFPGTWLEDAAGTARCSCGSTGCAAPGGHPSSMNWGADATHEVDAVRRMWSEESLASVLMPTGRSFDALDVPEVAGCLALARMERMDLPLGPVLCTPTRRLVFLVLPGTGAGVPDGLRRLGWPAGSLDLVIRGGGDYVVAPPTRTIGAGCVRWAREPSEANRALPDAGELLGPLAYACGREAAAHRRS